MVTHNRVLPFLIEFGFKRERERERERDRETETERQRERGGLYVQSTQIGHIRTSKAWKMEK